MEELLKAMQQNREDLVGRYASDLFVNSRDNTFNQAQINEFEHYAPCTVTTRIVELGAIKTPAGKIRYNDHVFYFG